MKMISLRALVYLLVAFGLVSCGGTSNNSTGASSSSMSITAYSFSTPPASGNINESKTISITVPYGTDVTGLVATFTTTGASVKVDGTVQVSGTTANNFTNPVVYTVTAADGSTTEYTVTVTVSLNSSKTITSFTLLGISGTINESAKTIALSVPDGTDVTGLVATFTTTGESVKVGGTVQVSGTTANNFTNPVVYTVTADDGSTTQYTVTVTSAPAVPQSLSLSTAGGTSSTIVATWTANTEIDLDHYILQLMPQDAITSTGTGEITEVSTSATSYTFTSLNTAVKYYVRIAAVNKAGLMSAWSGSDSYGADWMSICNVNDFDTTTPATPRNLALTSGVTASTNSVWVKATWTANIECDLSYYELEISEAGGNYIRFSASTNEYLLSSVLPNTTYTFRVRAKDYYSNNSTWTPYPYVTITSAKLSTPPAVPTGISATAGFQYIIVEWSANTESDLAYYEVWRNTTNATSTAAKVATVTNINYVDGNLTSGLITG